jgi:CO/xanthine dehydrogenase FAD-binding subunit
MLRFDYLKPVSLSEVLFVLDKYGDKAKLLLGGTDLAVLINDDLIKPELVIDSKGVEELRKLGLQGDSIYIRAGVTFNELISLEVVRKNVPVLWESSRTIASSGLRNRASHTYWQYM